jgi:hypothetical protein
MLCEFTTPGSSYDISDLLMSAGYPHISVTANTRCLAYECCLVYEVITKRIPALEDIRKGLECVKVLGKSSINLLTKWPELKARFFPAPEANIIDAATLRSHFIYEADADNSGCQQTRAYFENYLDELGARGCTNFSFAFNSPLPEIYTGHLKLT